LIGDWSAYSIDTSLKISSWQELADSNLRIGVRRGMKFVNQKMATANARKKLTKLDNEAHGAKMLLPGRLDVLLIPGYYNYTDLQKSNIKKVAMVKHLGTISEFPIFIFINKKHALLGKDIDAVLKKFATEGKIDQWQKDFGLIL
jgi:hypothetical protein